MPLFTKISALSCHKRSGADPAWLETTRAEADTDRVLRDGARSRR
jgi:hypothetical protein